MNGTSQSIRILKPAIRPKAMWRKTEIFRHAQACRTYLPVGRACRKTGLADQRLILKEEVNSG